MTFFFSHIEINRPFIIIYQDQTELEEIGVFNLSSARVDYKSDLEDMLQVRYLKPTMMVVYNNYV